MQTEWALNQLDEFLRLSESKDIGGAFSTILVSIFDREEVLSQWVVVKSILEEVYPNWKLESSALASYEFGRRRDAVIHARTLIQRDAEIRENLKPIGPILSSEKLHSVIWEPASLLWRDNHRRAAVQAASTNLDAYLQDLVARSDVSGRDLVNQSFSDEPPIVGKSRVRVPEQTSDEMTRSLQQGMRALGEACFAIARNLTSHGLADMSEQEGFERLAMLSLFTHILDTCSVVPFNPTPA